MQPERSLGLQWKLVLAQLAAGGLAIGAVALVQYLGARYDLQPEAAILASFGAGFAVSLAGAVVVFGVARTAKVRLWEAGDFADRIAQGDFTARLEPGGPDEIGWLEEQLNRMATHLETAVDDLRRLAEQNRRLAEEAGRGAALEERARLARDLHDTVNQQLFSLAMSAAALRRRVTASDAPPEAIAQELASLESLARQAHAQTRELILQLRPTELERHGLGPALEEYAGRLAAQEGWTLHAEIDRSLDLGEKEREALFRVAQEALANVSKHARAREVRVVLTREQAGIALRIIDDGVGFEPRRPPRPTAVGLVGMRERIEEIGGTFSLVSVPGEGTELVASIPESGENEENQEKEGTA